MIHLLFVASLIFSSCSRGERTDRGEYDLFERLEFTVDSSKLGAQVTMGEISFSVPAGWEVADSATFATVRQFAGKDTSASALEPLRVFKREGGGPMLLVSTFPRAVKLGDNFVPWAGEVARVYRAQRPSLEIEEQWLMLGGMEALQLRSRTDKLVHFKILLRTSSPISLDFTVPLQDWAGEARAVESSLGSIRRVLSAQ